MKRLTTIILIMLLIFTGCANSEQAKIDYKAIDNVFFTSALQIKVYGDWLYYLKDKETSYAVTLYRMKLDGSVTEKLYNTELWICDYEISAQYIFVIESETYGEIATITRIGLNDNLSTVISDTYAVTELEIYKDKLNLSDFDGLTQVWLDFGGIEISPLDLPDGHIRLRCLDGENLFYEIVDYSSNVTELYFYNFNGDDILILNVSIWSLVGIIEQYLYFYDSDSYGMSSFSKYDIETGVIECLYTRTSIIHDNVFWRANLVVGNQVYFEKVYADKSALFRCNFDGTRMLQVI